MKCDFERIGESLYECRRCHAEVEGYCDAPDCASPTKPVEVTQDVTEACGRSDERDAEAYAEKLEPSDNSKPIGERVPIRQVYLYRGFLAGRAGMVPASEVEKVKQSEFDRGWKAAIEFANAAWKPILNPKESDDV